MHEMTKIIYDDGTEKEFVESDFISRAELEENYVSKDDIEENYVSKEKYEQKKKQAKEAFRQKDLAEREAVANSEAELTAKIEEKVTFKAKHGFDEIPEEVMSAREKHPTLSWEEAYRVSGYQEPVNLNPNPGREDTGNHEKLSYTQEELAELTSNPAAYNAVASKIESGEIKLIM